ncbi:hypothetical protein TVAG_057030 [Trichomonas vaginalis G3]|uniref:Uncharacterized protein n=1 Tax=Trichomonas vaginalis (strain ATCC PRA-98 / G3) TaxID=412133 RepID=A2EKB1_TRIV3|nr:hypothetical protein TVAGG3_0772710 [Trichomonas vaginalis G3]EAY06909.1 hypothetical protein TVAG_057030 [Trichomonas vaginalis G3]KAI5513926.1 hypothetical protein TVAGG3_0772710 [Trichomonas vaginalis G3]|eukprot:XP_001319132.1 hypothetical protein [Trichomonas vaginalis G3]
MLFLLFRPISSLVNAPMRQQDAIIQASCSESNPCMFSIQGKTYSYSYLTVYDLTRTDQIKYAINPSSAPSSWDSSDLTTGTSQDLDRIFVTPTPVQSLYVLVKPSTSKTISARAGYAMTYCRA